MGKFSLRVTELFNNKPLRNIVFNRVLFTLSLIYFGLMACKYIIRPEPVNDEWHFFACNELLNSNVSNIFKIDFCIPYVLISFIPYLIGGIYGMRIVNLCLLLSFLLLVKFKFRSLWSTYFVSFCMFYWALTGYIFTGTDDAIFTMALASLLINFVDIIEKDGSEKFNKRVTFFATVFLLLSRPLFIVYIPIFIVSLICFKVLRREIKTITMAFLTFLIVNIPFLLYNHSFKYETKAPPRNNTWGELQYYSRREVYLGNLNHGGHKTWSDLEEFKKSGAQLPKNEFDAIFIDVKFFTVKTIENIMIAFYHSIRQNGLAFIFFIYLLIFKRIHSIQTFILLSFLISVLLFSSLVFGLVELRWLGGIFLASAAVHLKVDQKIFANFGFAYLQKSIILIFSVFGILRFIL